MRIGIGIGGMVGQLLNLKEKLQVFEAAERDGFDSVWVSHIRSWDALTLIALAGSRTNRIEMLAGVVPVYTRHPVLLAQQALTAQAATLTVTDRRTTGRLCLGIGLAHPEAVAAWGLSYDRPIRYMREYLAVVLPLLKNKEVYFKGEVHSARTSLDFPGVPAPSVILGAQAPKMLRMAGELADGTITWMVGRSALEAQITPLIQKGAERAGRSAPRICVALPVAVTDNPQAARQAVAKRFKIYGKLVNYRRILEVGGAAGPEDVAISGDEASVESDLRAIAAAGATDFLAAIVPVGPDSEASISRTRALLRSLLGRI